MGNVRGHITQPKHQRTEEPKRHEDERKRGSLAGPYAKHHPRSHRAEPNSDAARQRRGVAASELDARPADGEPRDKGPGGGDHPRQGHPVMMSGATDSNEEQHNERIDDQPDASHSAALYRQTSSATTFAVKALVTALQRVIKVFEH